MMAQLQLGRRGGRTGGGLVGSHTPRQRIFTSAARTLRSGERAGRHATVHNMPDDMRMRDIPANGGGGGGGGDVGNGAKPAALRPRSSGEGI